MNTRRPPAVARLTNRRASRGRDDVRKGVPLIIIAVLLLVGLIGAFAFVAGNRVVLSSETGCPTSGPSAITAILFDRTDPINEKQALYLKNKLDGFRERTQKFEEVDTYSLENQGDDIVRPLLSVCDPGKGNDVSVLIGNPKLLRERWEKQFDVPLREILEGRLQGGGAKTSAIFEAIQSVSLQSFQKAKLLPDAPRKLILVSDLIEFTKTLDFYKGDLNYQNFQQTNEARRLHTDLNEVSVEILFIPRVRPDRIGRLVSFWTNWFVDQGTRKESFKISWVEG
jgi:hypothetical protein